MDDSTQPQSEGQITDDRLPEDRSPIVASANPQASDFSLQSSDASSVELKSWQASEYVHHDKKASWYLMLFVIIAGLVAAAYFSHQGSYSSIAALVVGVVAFLMYSNRQPKVLNYQLSEDGLTVEDKFYGYDQFRSYAVISDIGWHMIDLDPVQRFMPRLTVLFADDDLDEIVQILDEFLPRQDRQPDAVERLTRFLRF